MDKEQLKDKEITSFEIPKHLIHNLNCSDRFQSFLDNSQYILKLLYNIEDYTPAIAKRDFTEKLTKYPAEGNMEYIKKLIELDNGTKNLIIAPTGSGKTFSIDAIFRQMNAESDGNQLLCLLCPNRVQNIQNAKSDDYNFEALVAGVQLDENDCNIRQISAVYDKVPSIISYKKAHPDCKLRVVIDECQMLICANIFREKAVNTIMYLINSKLADSYTFITATYESMCCFSFDNIVLFEDKNYKPVFKSINIKYARQKKFENLIVDTAITESKPYIRLNDTEMMEKAKATLLNMGQKCYSVTANDKGSTMNEDGTVTYNNVIFDHIVNSDDLYNNEGEADTILATSLLDAGTNFVKYSPESTPVFAVCNPNHLNVDEIEQSFNRFRPQKDREGNVIQLDHALIIHQFPSPQIGHAHILKQDSSGKMKLVRKIPSRDVVYTDRTSFEDRQKGYHNGIITISGKYFSDLEDGKYLIHIYRNGLDIPTPYNLYINCWTDEKPDTDTFNELMRRALDLTYRWLEDGKASSHNESLSATLDVLDAQTSNVAFIYNTGDEEIYSQFLSKPVKPFVPLVYIFENYLKEAKKQLHLYHMYMEMEELQEDADDMFSEITKQKHLTEHLNMLKKNAPHIGNALYLTESLKALIDYNKLFNSAYSDYQHQFYYYPERLEDELRLRLNIPVSASYYTPDEYELQTVEYNRDSILKSLNTLYQNPSTKEILCNVLHHGKPIPVDLDEKYRKMIAEILQSRLYKKEYCVLHNFTEQLTFDHIVKALNAFKSEKDVNKYIKRLGYMINNQSIHIKGASPFSTAIMRMQFTEQKTLISIVNKRRADSGTKKYTINEDFMKSLRDEFNEKMGSIVKGYTPKNKTPFKNLLFSVYKVINQNIDSRKPELTELILRVEDIPFI